MRRSLETTFLPPGENEDNLERDSDAELDIEATGGGVVRMLTTIALLR